MKKWVIGSAILTAVLIAALIVNINVGLDAPRSISEIGNTVTITIGPNQVYAAGTPDQTCDGTADNAQFTTAIAALPAGGGKISVLAGTYNWANATSVNVPANVTIEGVGLATYFNGDGATALFIATGNNTVFSNLRTDPAGAASGITMGATTGWQWNNVNDGLVYYAYRSTSGRSTFNDTTVASLTDSGLTSGRVPIVTTGGLLTDDNDVQFNTGTNVFTATGISTSDIDDNGRDLGDATTPIVAKVFPSTSSVTTDAANLIWKSAGDSSDETVINAAIEVINATGTRGTVLLTPGNYIVDGEIYKRKIVDIVGYGAKLTLKSGLHTNATNVIECETGDHNYTEIAGLEIDGNYSNNTSYTFAAWGMGIITAEIPVDHYDAADNIRLKDLNIHDCLRDDLCIVGAGHIYTNIRCQNSYSDHLIYVSAGINTIGSNIILSGCSNIGAILGGQPGLFKFGSGGDPVVYSHDNIVKGVTVYGLTETAAKAFAVFDLAQVNSYNNNVSDVVAVDALGIPVWYCAQNYSGITKVQYTTPGYSLGAFRHLSCVGNSVRNVTLNITTGAGMSAFYADGGSLSISDAVVNVVDNGAAYLMNVGATSENTKIDISNVDFRDTAGFVLRRNTGNYKTIVTTGNIKYNCAYYAYTGVLDKLQINEQAKTSWGNLVAGKRNSLVLRWQNPETYDILVRRIVVDVVGAGGASSTMAVGIADGTAGTHTGSNDAAVLTDVTKNWTTDALAGLVIYNQTDGSASTITSNTATTVTCATMGDVAHGTNDDWDANDYYSIAINAGSEFFTAIPIDTPAIYDSWNTTDTGAQTKWILLQDSASATDSWLVGRVDSGHDAGSLTGTYHIEYIPR